MVNLCPIGTTWDLAGKKSQYLVTFPTSFFSMPHLLTLHTAPTPNPSHREAAAKEQAAANYQKAHAAGKTDQFKKDMERLQEVKRRREREAAERKAKDEGEHLGSPRGVSFHPRPDHQG